MKKGVRLIDIGNELGVSAVTVSNALLNQKGVSSELRAKIVDKAIEMGYVNTQSAGKKEKTISLGVLIHDQYLDKYATFYWHMYQRMSIKAVENGCITMVEIINQRDVAERNIPVMVRDDKIQALLILGELPTAYLELLKGSIAIPMVFVDFYKKNIRDVDSIISNNFYGMYFLTNEVIKRGHRDLMFVGAVNATASITDRFFGFLKSLTENGIEYNSSMIIPDRTADNKYIPVEVPEHIPSAIVCNSDLVAADISSKLIRAGYRVPEDVSVVGFDNYLFPGLSEIEFTTYDVNVDEMVETAISIIVKRINKESMTGPRIYMTSGHIVERESLMNKQK